MTSIVGSTISSTIFSANSTSLGLNERTAFFMDNIFAIGFGLSLRLLITLISQHSPSSLKVTGTLVGLWEGIVLLHFTQKWPRSYDPYVAYGVRMFVDLMVTESVPRMVLVAIWTGLGMVLADVGPGVWKDSGGRRIWSRFKRDMKVAMRRMSGMPRIAIPFLYRPRTVRFVPSSRSRTTSVVSPTASVVSEPTYSVVSTATAPAARTIAPRYIGTPAPSVYSTTTTSSTTASSVTPLEPAGPTVSVHPPTPGTTPTPRKTRVPGHFMRDSETETEISALPRNRIPYAGTSTNSSGSASGLTTDNELLGTSRGSRYSLFPVRTKKPDLRLTESDTDDDASSTTTETPTPDAHTLRDISMEVVEAAEAEQLETTPTQSPITTFTHPTLPVFPNPSNELLISELDDPTAPKTPLPPVDQVPDIPDPDVDDESWEKVERDVADKVEVKRSNSKGKAKAEDDPLETKSEFSVKEKGKAKSVTPEPELAIEPHSLSQPSTPSPPESTKTPEPIIPVPPRLPPKDISDPPAVTKDLKSTLISSEKPEKAMSEPGWLDSLGDLVGKKKNKIGKVSKSKSVVSAGSSVVGTMDAFDKPGTISGATGIGSGGSGAGTGTGIGGSSGRGIGWGIGRSPLSGNATPTVPDEVKGSPWSNPWGSTKASSKPPSEINPVAVSSTVDKPKSERSQRSPPPTFSQIYPDGPPIVLPGDSTSGIQDVALDNEKDKDKGSVVGGGGTIIGLGSGGNGDGEGNEGNRISSPVPPSVKAASTRAPSTKARSTVSVSPENEPEHAKSQEPPVTLDFKPEDNVDDNKNDKTEGDERNENGDGNDNENAEDKKQENDANEDMKGEQEEEEPETDTELLSSNAPSSERLTVSLDLLKQIDGLRKILSKDGGGDDKQIAKQLRRYERRVSRISCKDWTDEPIEPNKLEVPVNSKLAIEQIEDRMWRLLTNKDAKERGYDYLEVTLPKAAKALKGKQLKTAIVSALDSHNLEHLEDPNNGKSVQIAIPFKAGSGEGSEP